MCGIAGVQLSKGAVPSTSSLRIFERGLDKRGPDGFAYFSAKSTLLFSSRLAIVDIPDGGQPFVSPNGVALFANGEIYNAAELRAKLADYPFRSLSDCETILAAYERYGFDFVDHLRGMYAVALYDPALQELIIARDPYGIKPLYYSESEKGFAFASTIDVLKEAGFCSASLAGSAIPELLQLKYNTGECTIFSDVRRLEPGAVLSVEGGKTLEVRSSKIWPRGRQLPAPRGTSGKSTSALVSEFEDVMCDSVAVHMRSDAPLCTFFSGGIDSTILLLVARKVSSLPLSGLTVGYEGAEAVDESAWAMHLAAGLDVDCERIEIGFEYFWRRTPEIVEAIDDPMADMAVLPLFALGEAAFQRGFKVALTGEGADEVFGGYSRYRRATLPWFLRPNKSRRGAFSSSVIPGDRFDGWTTAMDRLEREQEKTCHNRLQLLQAIDVLERLPNCLLIKLDRALMANSVEGRTPFLDKEVLAFARRVPDPLKATPFMGKSLLRAWVAKEYPQAQPYARKRGFKTPIGRWIYDRKNDLGPPVARQAAIKAMFSQREIATIFERANVDEQPAWSVLFYALWHSAHVLGIKGAGDIASTLKHASG